MSETKNTPNRNLKLVVTSLKLCDYIVFISPHQSYGPYALANNLFMNEIAFRLVWT